ncbi:MAG: cupin domain-containing protein [Candidatus Eisenbacteria bacterium]
MPFLSIDGLRESEPVPGFRLRFVHSGSMTIAFWDIEAGAAMPEHAHPHEQVAIMIEGEFELVVGGEPRVVRPGDVAVIPSGTPHSGRALTRCRINDAFHPERDEWR